MYKPGDELYAYIEGNVFRWSHTRAYRDKYAELCIHPCKVLAVQTNQRIDSGLIVTYVVGYTSCQGKQRERVVGERDVDMYKEPLLKRVIRDTEAIINKVQPTYQSDRYAYGRPGVGVYVRVCRGCSDGPCCHEATTVAQFDKPGAPPCEGEDWWFIADPTEAAKLY